MPSSQKSVETAEKLGGTSLQTTTLTSNCEPLTLSGSTNCDHKVTNSEEFVTFVFGDKTDECGCLVSLDVRQRHLRSPPARTSASHFSV